MITKKMPKFYMIANKPLQRFQYVSNPIGQAHYEIAPELYENVTIPNNVIRRPPGVVYSNCLELLLSCNKNFRNAVEQLCEDEFFQYVLIKFDGTFETTDVDASELYDNLIDIIHTPSAISDSDIYDFINKMVKSGQLQVSDDQTEILDAIGNSDNNGDDWKKDATYDYYRGLKGSI